VEKKTNSPFLVSIDPGVYSCAVAIWKAPSGPLGTREAVLYGAGLSVPSYASQTPLEVLSFIESLGASLAPVIIETPVKYATRRSTHRDVERMLVVVRALRAAYPPSSWFEVSPFGWKGNTPKGIQAARIISALSKDEHDAVTWPKKSLRHNVIDAIGIGLWHTGRLGRGSV